MVAQDESDDEEGDTEEDGHASDKVDKVVDLLGDGSLARVQTRSETGDAAHYLWEHHPHQHWYNDIEM